MQKSQPPVAHDKSFAKSCGNCWSHLSTGETLSLSPSRSRSYKDWSNPLEWTGRVLPSAHQSLVPPSEIVVWWDGDLSSSALKRLAQHHKSGSAEWLAKRQRMEKPLPYDRFSILSKRLVELPVVDGQEDVE